MLVCVWICVCLCLSGCAQACLDALSDGDVWLSRRFDPAALVDRPQFGDGGDAAAHFFPETSALALLARTVAAAKGRGCDALIRCGRAYMQRGELSLAVARDALGASGTRGDEDDEGDDAATAPAPLQRQPSVTSVGSGNGGGGGGAPIATHHFVATKGQFSFRAVQFRRRQRRLETARFRDVCFAHRAAAASDRRQRSLLLQLHGAADEAAATDDDSVACVLTALSDWATLLLPAHHASGVPLLPTAPVDVASWAPTPMLAAAAADSDADGDDADDAVADD